MRDVRGVGVMPLSVQVGPGDCGTVRVVCRMPLTWAESAVRKAGRRRLHVAGFRPGRAPFLLQYRDHKLLCDHVVLGSLRAGPPAALWEALCDAFTPPEYRVLGCGTDGVEVEVTFYQRPAAPNPLPMHAASTTEVHRGTQARDPAASPVQIGMSAGLGGDGLGKQGPWSRHHGALQRPPWETPLPGVQDSIVDSVVLPHLPGGRRPGLAGVGLAFGVAGPAQVGDSAVSSQPAWGVVQPTPGLSLPPGQAVAGLPLPGTNSRPRAGRGGGEPFSPSGEAGRNTGRF